MAVGKSAVGRALAKRLKWRFVDLDRVIEKNAGMTVKAIFSHKGESFFRQLEKSQLAKILEQNGQIIATGGGVVMDQDNLKLLRERTLLVCLTATSEVLLKRAGTGGKRPLLKGGDRRGRIEELLKQRQKNYALAHAAIDTSDLTIGEIVERIVALASVQA